MTLLITWRSFLLFWNVSHKSLRRRLLTQLLLTFCHINKLVASLWNRNVLGKCYTISLEQFISDSLQLTDKSEGNFCPISSTVLKQSHHSFFPSKIQLEGNSSYIIPQKILNKSSFTTCARLFYTHVLNSASVHGYKKG